MGSAHQIQAMQANAARASALVASLGRIMPHVVDEMVKLVEAHDDDMAIALASSVLATTCDYVAMCSDETVEEIVERVIEVLVTEQGLSVPVDRSFR